MIKLTDHSAVLEQLKISQDSDRDQREQARECEHFIYKKDGQWEPGIVERFNRYKRPRYTFDRTTPVVDQVAGEMEQTEFSIRVSPTDAMGTDDIAETYEGMIRNIINISDANAKVFHQADRGMIVRGVDGWEIVNDYIDGDSFEQDLYIKKIHNYIDRVWFDAAAQEQDMSDARWCWVLDAITKEEYDSTFPDGSGLGIAEDKSYNVYYNKTDFILVARFLYKKPRTITLIQMSDGSVYEDNDDFNKIKDELTANGIVETKRRDRKSWRVYQRMMDGGGWLNEEQETVFDYLPVVPEFGNFCVSENKVIYRGEVLKIMDSQRVYNYTRSRQIEEGALSPRAKYWMTPAQASGHEAKLATLNTNADPVQFFNPDSNNPGPPQQNGGAQINPGLENIAQAATQDITATSNQFAAQRGDNPNLQSGIALSQQIEQGNTSTIKYYTARKVAMAYMARVLINAIPKVYDSTRQQRILNEDGTDEIVTLNQPYIDSQTGEAIELNNLAIGKYDVSVSVGEPFQNRRQKGTEAIVKLGAIDPSIIQLAGDQLIKNLGFPGSEDVAMRKRAQMIAQGLIPQEQLTQEELAEIEAQQAQNQNPPADPAMMMAAQAEMEKAKAQQQEAANKTAALQLEAQKLQLEIDKFRAEMQGKLGVEGAKLEQEQQKIDQNDAKLQMQLQQQQFSQMMEMIKTQNEALNKQAATLNLLKDAMGADAIVSPQTAQAYSQQTEIIQDTQDEL